MGQVNSHGERRSSERDFEPTARAQGAQPSAKNGRIPRVFRANQQTKRLSAWATLAEGEELSSNILFLRHQGLTELHRRECVD
jgi:hypothetical protein